MFMAGVGSIYLADIIIARSPDPAVVAQWATLKSFMMIGGVMALFGMEQLLVREPRAAKHILKATAINVTLVSVAASIGGYFLGYAPSIMVGLIAIAGFSIVNLCFQWVRSNLQVNRAYFANSSWRVLFLCGVVLFSVGGWLSVPMALMIAMIVGVVIAVTLALRTRAESDLISPHREIDSLWGAYGVGSAFLVSALSLSIASYGEALVVKFLGSDADVSTYFRAAVVFLFPGVMFNQYLSAIAGPFLRQNKDRAASLLRRHGFKLVLLIIALWPALLGGGYVLARLLYGDMDLPLSLALVLTFTSCCRLFYVLPNSFVGMLATRQQLRVISFAYLGCSLLLPLLAWILHGQGVDVLIAVALANLVNWILRCLFGLGVIRQTLAQSQDTSISQEASSQ